MQIGLNVDIQENICHLKINHPPANTWTLDNLKALLETIQMLDRQPEIFILIISGSGNKFFSAGADLGLFSQGSSEIAQKMSLAFGDAFEALSRFKGISIAAINGYAMGGGLECALACDFRIVEPHVELGLPEASVGLLPCAGGTQWLSWHIGESWAKRMILMGERIGAQKAVEIGLADHMASTGTSLQEAESWAKKLFEQSPDALIACKRLIQGARNTPPAQQLIHEREEFLRLFGHANQKEGVQAFFEKRKPLWSY
jgi:enoyl-CoA hydratase/carnithine racemase